jgi:hypothetical protein
MAHELAKKFSNSARLELTIFAKHAGKQRLTEILVSKIQTELFENTYPLGHESNNEIFDI